MSVEELASENLEELAPLWGAREHLLAVAPRWLPDPYDAEESWRRRSSQYRCWLAERDSFALVARRSCRAVGYAFVHVRGGSPTWAMSERAGELETLAVPPEERGRGIGRALLAAVSQRLQNMGAAEISLHLLVGNDQAARFYEREGFRPFAV